MWTPSNTSITMMTQLTIPSGSSITSRTLTQVHNKVPTGYNGMPHINSQNCPLLWSGADHYTARHNFVSDLHPHLVASSLDAAKPPPQIVTNPISRFHNTLEIVDRQTDGQMAHATLPVPIPAYALL